MRRFTALALLAALAACDTGGPYLYVDPTVTISKAPDLIRKYGYLMVCYDDGEEKQADVLAAETCAEYSLRPLKASDLRYQCSLTKPHQAVYYCVDPAKRMANGHYINPLDKHQVKEWQEQQQRLEAAARRHAGQDGSSAPAATTSQPPAAPGPAELGAPPPPAVPLTVPAKPEPKAAPSSSSGASDFDLPAGGWGQAWDAAGGER